MAFDTRKLREDAKTDFRKAWLESTSLVPKEGEISYSLREGKAHPVQDLIQKVRKVFLDMGFDEIENQMFISEEDVYKQYGAEAPVILDRVYYLAGLPRPDIGLSDEKIAEVKSVADVKVEDLKKILREYREGEVEGDNLLEEMVTRLKITTDEAAEILSIFPEFKNITPVAGKTTLRSHMTGAWFPTIAALYGRRDLPLLLFSVGLRFRREQKVDATHLRAHYGASMVIVDDNINVEAGRKLTEEILKRLDFTDIRFVQKKATSNYYAPDSEYEVFSGDIEVADIGMYSPVALAQYDIPVNVFNLGFGLERFIMAKEKHSDVRELLYPQFYENLNLTDEEILDNIDMIERPKTEEGKELAIAIMKTANKHGNENSPCSFKAFEGDLGGKKVTVSVVEKEDGTKLIGPAALNEVVVYDGALYGIPKDTSKLKGNIDGILENGVHSVWNFIDAISNYFAAEIERQVQAGETQGFIQVKMAKTSADINIKVGEKARRFMEGKNKPISIKGPVFTAVEFTVE